MERAKPGYLFLHARNQPKSQLKITPKSKQGLTAKCHIKRTNPYSTCPGQEGTRSSRSRGAHRVGRAITPDGRILVSPGCAAVPGHIQRAQTLVARLFWRSQMHQMAGKRAHLFLCLCFSVHLHNIKTFILSSMNHMVHTLFFFFKCTPLPQGHLVTFCITQW